MDGPAFLSLGASDLEDAGALRESVSGQTTRGFFLSGTAAKV